MKKNYFLLIAILSFLFIPVSTIANSNTENKKLLVNNSSSPGTISWWEIEETFLIWEHIADKYELEFNTQNSCCGLPCTETDGRTFTVVVEDNKYNLDIVVQELQQKCFSWRIRALEDGSWSEWCCLAHGAHYGFPAGNLYGNPLGDSCSAEPGELILGSIRLYENPVTCPSDSFEICGQYITPCFYNLESLILEIWQDGILIKKIEDYIDHGYGVFCFIINPDDFGAGATGYYDFNAVIEFSNGSEILIYNDLHPNSVYFPYAHLTGSISLINTSEKICPSESFQVCGHYNTPCNYYLSKLFLEIIKDGVVINIIENFNASGNGIFCFIVNPDDFDAGSGNYDFNVVVEFENGPLHSSFNYTKPNSVYIPYPQDTGSIVLYNINQITCPTESFEVCGQYITPCNSQQIELLLEIIQEGILINKVENVSYDASGRFCFIVNPEDFGTNPSGSYDLNVTVTFYNGSQYGFFDYLIPNIVSFSSNPITYWSFTNWTLSWENVADSYTLEFGGDYQCCQQGSIGNPGSQRSYTTTSNFIDLGIVNEDLQNKCFSWRVKPACGEWSDWCCISIFNVLDNEWEIPPGSSCWAMPQSRENFNENVLEPKSTVYPNPVNDIATISQTENLTYIIVSDIYGKILMEMKNIEKNNEIKIDFSKFSSGIYIILSDNNFVKKIIKN